MVLLTSSLGLCPFSVEVDADRDWGLLKDPRLLLPSGYHKLFFVKNNVTP
jgi:hypothetical protein